MPGFHCELEHDVAAFIYMVFLTFLEKDTFKAMNWVFSPSFKGYIMHHNIWATLGTGES